MFGSWGVNEWVAAASALLALLSFLFNWAVVNRQTKLQFESLKAQLDTDVMDWAHETINLVAEAEALAKGRGVFEDFRARQLDVSQKLSAAADRGRLFFPNETHLDHGTEKEAAFQGFRPPLLDSVVFAYGQLCRIESNVGGPDEVAAAFLLKCRRLLVSELQNAIDPRRRREMIRQLAEGRMDDTKSSFRVAAELGEDMEARFPGFLDVRRDSAWIEKREMITRSNARKRR